MVEIALSPQESAGVAAATAGPLAGQPPARPQVRRLARDDLAEALAAGWKDFRRAPSFGLFFGALYMLGGWAIVLLALFSDLYYLSYPLATGFALIGPFVAAGLYEVSRRLEMGEPLGWRAVLGAVRKGGTRDLGWMALVTLFAFIIWVDFALFLYLMFFGLHMPAWQEFLLSLVTTLDGLTFFVVGNLAGAAIAFFIFCITVVSCPLLLDRDIDFVTAMLTSLRAVGANRAQMVSWAGMIAMMMCASLLTGLLALVVVLPLLGHATWHVYRRIVVPAA